jgi:hypothetical protein
MHACAVLAEFQLSPPVGRYWAYGAAAWILFALPLSLAGLGLIASRWLGSLKAELLPVVGLAAFVFIGGILNLLHIAFGCSIGLLLAVGFLEWVRCAWRRIRLLPAGDSAFGGLRSDPEILLLGLLLIGVLALTASSQISPTVFNWRDDLQKYFAHPVRMLETGTVFGSPLSSIGIETLGGLAFLHASVLICLPLQAINGVDTVLGLLLCLIPLFAFGARHRASRAVAAAAMASVVIIDPYYVNVSALYLGSALIMAAVILAAEGPRPGGNAAALGLVYAALVSLKPIFILFAAPHFVLLACMGFLQGGGPGRAAKWALTTAAWSAVFISPWIAVHLPHYLSPTVQHSPGSSAMVERSIHLLGLGPMPMGLTGLRAYTVLAVTLGVLVLLCLGLYPGARKGAVRQVGIAAAALIPIMVYPFMIFVFPRLVGYANADSEAVRYGIPIMIGVFPIALCVASATLEEGCPGMAPNTRMGVCFALGVAPLVLFSGTAAERFRDAATFGTFMPFPVAHQPELAVEMKYALGPGKQGDVQAQQALMPAGASVIAWINTPYFLDYARNTVFDAEPAGISTRWAIPPEADYILWEYRGSPDPQARTRQLVATLPAMDKRRATPLMDFDRVLWSRVKAGKVIFRNEEFLLVRTANARDKAP